MLFDILQHAGMQPSIISGAGLTSIIKEGKIGIDDTLESIEGQTLGSYLYSIYPKESQPFQNGLERIRNRYTTRKMYVDEFEMIWNKQAQFHSTLNEDLKQFLLKVYNRSVYYS